MISTRNFHVIVFARLFFKLEKAHIIKKPKASLCPLKNSFSKIDTEFDYIFCNKYLFLELMVLCKISRLVTGFHLRTTL